MEPAVAQAQPTARYQLTLQISREVTDEALQAFGRRLGAAKVVAVRARLPQPSVRYWTFVDYGAGGGAGLEYSDESEEGDEDEESDEFEDCDEYEEGDGVEDGGGSGEVEGDAAE
ncbi:hypothetical protein OEZ85_010937 [Tetradesmus obliquus]|uniref:Uncharacterized protein n=1 Tax=Tetradesmus obliquus TaxID=3088 RepID=A0ABY8TNS6_TETOB|nr:hypothetical protein OEZ85_010937 [Tetradesmus obliquus]